jgi:hypothetical protein
VARFSFQWRGQSVGRQRRPLALIILNVDLIPAALCGINQKFPGIRVPPFQILFVQPIFENPSPAPCGYLKAPQIPGF